MTNLRIVTLAGSRRASPTKATKSEKETALMRGTAAMRDAATEAVFTAAAKPRRTA